MTYMFRYVGDDRRLPEYKPPKKQAPKPTHHPRTAFIPEPVIDRTRDLMPVPMPQSLWTIMKEVCKRHKCTPGDLAGKGRESKLIHARAEYVVRARNETKYSYPHIAKTIKKDHTTAIHAYQAAMRNPEKINPFVPVAERRPKPMRLPRGNVMDISLSPRQKIVYEYMQQGKNNKEIAALMGRTERQAKEDRYMVTCKNRRRAFLEGQERQANG